MSIECLIILLLLLYLNLGAGIAQYAYKNLHKCITKRPEYKKNKISDALQLVILYKYSKIAFIVSCIFFLGFHGHGHCYG